MTIRPEHVCRPFGFLLGCCLVWGSVAGCARSDAPESEEEHLEHFVPAHKPHSFEELVTAVSKRRGAFGDASLSADAAAVTELSDIIGWIPELAADCELRQSDWERAAAAGGKLQALWQERFGPQGAAGAPAGSAGSSGNAGDRLAEVINELQSLVPASRTLPYGGRGGNGNGIGAPAVTAP